jgi:hypothetical protein
MFENLFFGKWHPFAHNKLIRFVSFAGKKDIIPIFGELIRQFYTVPRCFRVISPNDLDTSSKEYIVYENSGISGLKQTADTEGEEWSRHPVFDISIAAEKIVDSKRAELNSMAKELYTMGVFEPQNRESARLLIEMMDFEGRDELLSKLIDEKKEGSE